MNIKIFYVIFMDKTKWNTIVIKVPDEMIYTTKTGILKIGKPLTKTKNIATRNKEKALILEEDTEIDEPIIINLSPF